MSQHRLARHHHPARLAHLATLVPAVIGACAAPSAAAPTVHGRTTAAAAPAAPIVHPVRVHDDQLWILLDQPAPPDASWTVLAPMTFDDTAVAPAPRLARARDFTLVGPDGTCEVASAEQLLVGRGHGRDGRVAMVVDRAACRLDAVVVAVDGAAAAPARAERSTGRQDSDGAVATWIEDRLAAPLWTSPSDHGPAVYREWLPGTDVEVIYAFLDRPTAHADATIDVVLRRGDRLLARLGEVQVLAHLRWAGADYAVVADDASGRVRPVDVTR